MGRCKSRQRARSPHWACRSLPRPPLLSPLTTSTVVSESESLVQSECDRVPGTVQGALQRETHLAFTTSQRGKRSPGHGQETRMEKSSQPQTHTCTCLIRTSLPSPVGLLSRWWGLMVDSWGCSLNWSTNPCASVCSSVKCSYCEDYMD